MKQKVRRISKSTLSVILTLCMIMSCFTVGLVATDAAKVQSESTGENFTNGSDIYLDLTEPFRSPWMVYSDNGSDKLATIYMYLYGNSGNTWVEMKRINTNQFVGKIPSSGTYDSVIFVSSKNGGNWTDKRLQTEDCPFTSGNNKAKLTGINGDKYTVSWDGNASPTYFVHGSTSTSNPKDFTNKDLTMTLDGSVYTATKTLTAGAIYRFFINCGSVSSSTGSAGSDSFADLINSSTSALYEGGGFTETPKRGDYNVNYSSSLSIKYYYIQFIPSSAGNYIITYNPTNNSVTVSPASATLTPAASPSAGGTAAVSDSENGTYNASPLSGISTGSYVWVQATPNAYYEFDGWQSTSGLTYDSPNALKSRVKVDSNATATAKFKKQTVVSSLTLSASPTTLTEVNETTTLTVTASGLQSGVTNITYEIYDSSSPSTPVATYSSTTGETSHAFSLAPNAYQKTYYAKVKQTGTENYDSVQSNNVTVTNNNDAYRTPYTVTFSSGGNGTVTAKTYDGTPISSGDTVLDGTVVFFTASPNTGYQFKNWTGSYTDTASTISKTITSNVNVTGNFAQKGYKVYTSSNHSMKELPNGWYITTDQISNSSYFKVVRLSDNKNSNSNAGDENSGTNLTDNIGQIDTWDTDSNVTTHSFHNKSGESRYVVYDPSTDRVWLTTNSDGYDVVTVYVKDGTVRKKDGGDATCHWGYSAITSTEGTSAPVTHGYKSKPTGGTEDNQVRIIQIPIADIKKGVKLTIRTNVTKSGYFVKGFDVTGRETQGLISQEFDSSGNELSTYADTDAQTKINGNYNEFVLDLQGLTVREIEVTPIYFKKETVSGDNVRFYADNFAGTVKSKWKETIAVYAYGNDSAQLGSYPGQPMVYEGGRYYMDIENTATGLTINNYAWDRVHSDIYYNTKSVTTDTYDNNDALYQIVKKVNRQTYDYDEFKVIQDIIAADDNLEDEDIIFSFRYRDLVDNDSSNFGAADDWDDYPQNLTTSSFEFEDLTDFYGNKTDLYGGMVNDENAGKNPLLVVSNGYDHNSVGNYATSWAIYKPTNQTGDPGSYTKIAVAGKGCTSYVSGSYRSESWLIDPATTASAKSAINTNGGSTFENYPVKICYEHEVYRGYANGESGSGDGQLGYRVDGRWYYSRSDQPLQAHVITEYGDSLTATSFTRDYFQFGGVDYTHEGYDKTQNTGLTTGVKAYFTNEGPVTSTAGTKTNVYGTTECDSVSDGEHTFDLEAVPDADGEYMFLGWYLYNGEGREPSFITKNPDFSVEAATNDVFIARFVKTPDNVLVISHQPHPDSEGAADRYVQVTVKNQSNETVFAFDKIKNARNLDYIYLQKSDNYKLEIVLSAQPRPGLNYDGFYESIQTAVRALAQQGVIASVSSVDTTGGVYSVTVTVNVTSLYTGDTQTIKALPFYSKFETPKHDLTITKTTDYNDGSDFNILIKTKGPDAEPTDPLSVYNGAFKLNNVAKTSSDYEIDGTIKIKSGDVITIEDIPEDSQVQVLEKLSGSSNYTHSLSTSNVTGAKTGTLDTVTTGSDGTGYAFTTGAADSSVIISNLVKREDFTVTKIVDQATDPATNFTIHVTLGGSAIPSTYTYTVGETTSNFDSNGNATISGTTGGTTMTVNDVPVGAVIEVWETNLGTGYSFGSISITNGIGGTISGTTATFTVTEGTAHAVQINNIKKHNVTIRKTLSAADTDIVDTATAFGIRIQKQVGSEFVNVTEDLLSDKQTGGTVSYNSATGTYPIHNLETLTLQNVTNSTVLRVIEVDHDDTHYRYYDTVVTASASPTDISGQDGKEFTVTNADIDVNVINQAKRMTVVVNKETDFADDDGSIFHIKVETKQFNGNGQYAPYAGGVVTAGTNPGNATPQAAIADETDPLYDATDVSVPAGTYRVLKGNTITFSNVPVGMYFQITEPHIGKSHNTTRQRFTLDVVNAYYNSDSSTLLTVTSSGSPTTDLTGKGIGLTGNATFTVKNKIMKNTVKIIKEIDDDVTDDQTTHTVQVTMLRNGQGSAALTDIQYTKGNDTTTKYDFTSGGTLNVVEGEAITFLKIPVGTYVTVTETAAGTSSSSVPYEFKNISVATGTAEDITSSGQTVSFKTIDASGGANVTITNQLTRYQFAVTKQTNVSDNVSAFKVKIQKSSDDSTYFDFVPTQAGDFSITNMTDADAFSQRWDSTHHVFTIKKDETLTVKKIPYGTYLTVQELEGSGNMPTGYVLYSYTPGADTAANELSDVTGGGKKIQITDNKAVVLTNYKVQNVTINKTVNNSSINNINFPISVTLTRPGASSAETEWMAQKSGDSSASSTNLSSITLKNGESITLKDVPVNSTIIVTEGALSGSGLSDYTFVSAVATPSTGSPTSNPSGETYVQFTLTDYSTSVAVTNKINDKNVTVKKAIDAGTNTDFPIKVEYYPSNGSDWVAYYPGSSQNVFDSDGIAMILSGGDGVRVDIPLDAKIRVTEMVSTTTGDKAMPSGFTFEKMTRTRSSTTSDLTTSGASYADTNSSDTTNGDIITVNNTQLRTVSFTKTTNVSTDTASEFKITVQKKAPGENSFSYVDSLLDSSDNTVSADGDHKFTIHRGDTLHLANVVKGTQFIVTETDTTASYTFNATDTGVTGVSGTDNPDINATDQTVSFTANTTSDPIVTINNVSVDKPFTIIKNVDVAVPSGGSFKIKLWKKALGASAFVPYASANGFDANGEQRITPGTNISITAQPVGTQFYLEEITNDASNPVGYNYDSVTLSGLTEISSPTLPSGAGSSGKAFTVENANSQTATINNIKKSQLIVTKSIANDTANKQFPVVIYKYNTTTSAYDIPIIGSTTGVTVTDSSDNTLSGRYDNGAFYISNGDKIKVDAVMGDKFKVIENALSGNDYLGYEFVSYSDGTTTLNTQASGQEITIGDNSVTETITNALKTKTLTISKTADVVHNDEQTFTVQVDYWDVTLNNGAGAYAPFAGGSYSINTTPDPTAGTLDSNGRATLANGQTMTVALKGVPAVAKLKVTEVLPNDTKYKMPTVTVSDGTEVDAIANDNLIEFTSTESQSPAVSIANHIKTANVKVKKVVSSANSGTTTFPIVVSYTTTDGSSTTAHNNETKILVHNEEATLSNVPVGSTITVSETAPAGYELVSIAADGTVVTGSDGSFTVNTETTGETTGLITVTNNRLTAGFTIKKETNINNTVDEFKIKIFTKDNASVEDWTPYVAAITTDKEGVSGGTRTANISGGAGTSTYGEYTITKNETLSISGLSANSLIKVLESDYHAPKYGFVSITGKDENTTVTAEQNENAAYATISGAAGQGVIITNNVQTTSVTIHKTVLGGVTGASVNFPITVKITDEVTSSTAHFLYGEGENDYFVNATGKTVNITGGQTLTITGVPIGASVEVSEGDLSALTYSFTSIDADNVDDKTIPSGEQKVTFKTKNATASAVTIQNTVDSKDVVIRKNVTNSNKTDQAFTINVSLKLNGSGDSTTTTAWTYVKGSTTNTNASLTSISLNNGDYITLKAVPVGAYITVAEPSVPSGYSFDSIVAKHSGTTVIGSSNTSPYSFTLDSSYTSPEVTVNNKINDKTVNIKKVTDSSDGSGFYIKVEYKQSNSGANWTTVANDSHFTSGIASFAHDTEYTVSIPSDAQIKVSELNETGHTMPSGYEFEKFSLTHNSSTSDLSDGVNGMVYTGAGDAVNNGDTIIVNNTKLHEVKVTKTATDNPNTSDKFAFKLQKQNGSDWDDVATLTNVSVGTQTAFSTKVRKGTVIRVIEDGLNTAKYDFDDNATNTKVTTSGVTGTNVKDTTNGIYGITNITMPTNSDLELTINNLVKTQTVKVTKTTDDSTDTTTAFGIKIQKKLEGASGEFADFTTSEQYKLNGAGTGTNFASGSTVSLKRGEYFTVEVPIDTQIQVSEPSPTAPYSLAGIDVDHSKSDPAKSYSNGVLTFTVDSGTMPTVTVTNSKSLTLTVTKQTDSTDGTDDLFPILIEKKVDSEFIPVTSGFTIGSLTAQQLAARVSDNKISIKKGETITITNIPTNTEFRVSEPTVTSGYEFGSVDVPNTADGIVADGTNGKKFTITTSNVAVTVNNKKQHTVSIDKIVPSAEIDNVSNPDFTVKIETKAPGAENFTVYDDTVTGGTKVGSGNDTTYTFKAGGTITLGTKYIAGTQVRVTEVIDSSNKYEWISSVLANAESTEYTSSDKVITFTMRAQDENVDITNNIKKHDVTINKAYLTGDSNSATHTVNVTVKQFGSTDSAATFTYVYDGSTVTGATASTNLTIQKGKTLTIKDVYVGAQVTVTESSTATGYVFDHIEYKAASAASATTGNNFIMPDETVAVTVYNKLTQHTVTIRKVVLNRDDTPNTEDSTEFTLAVTNGGTSSTPKITRASTLTYTVDYGTTFTVNETSLPSGYELVSIKIGDSVVTNVEQTITENTTFVVTNKISAPTEYSYQIKYIFPSRYDHLTGQRKNGTQSFTRKGVLSADDSDIDVYFSEGNITEALVLAKQPTESNFYMDMSISSIEIGDIPTGENPVYTATATFTDTAKTLNVHFRFPYEVEAVCAEGSSTPGAYKPKDEKPERSDSMIEIDNKILGVGYQSIPTVTVRETVEGVEQDVTYYTEAADTIIGSGGTEQKFRYWSIESKNAMGEWVEVAKSGYRLYKYSTFNEYRVTPIYGDDTQTANTTTINYLGATRNYWKMADASDTAAKGKRSKNATSENFVSADFDVSFQYQGKVIIEDPTAANYNTGVIIEKVDDVDEDYALDEWGITSKYSSDYSHYVSEYAGSAVDPSNAAGSWIENYLKTGALNGHTLFTNHTIAHNKLTNKNRTELGVSTTVGHTDTIDGVVIWDTLSNTYVKKDALFRAYAYIYDPDTQTVLSLSTPVYYTLKNVAEMN